MHHNRLKLNLHKYKTAGMSQFNIDKLSDDDDNDFDDKSSESEFDVSLSESESFPDTESTGPSEATTDEMMWDRMRAPVLGITAHSRRLSLDMKSRRPAVLGNNKNVFQSYEDVSIDYDDSSALYSRIERRSNRDYRQDRDVFRAPRQPSHKSKGLTMIEELSPIRSDSLSTSNEVPPPMPLRSKSEWNPQLTSTTTSFQPLMPLLPKTNPHLGPKLMSSTPRSSSQQRLYRKHANHGRHPKIEQRFSRPDSREESDSSPISWNENYKKPNAFMNQALCKPENYGLPSALAKNLGINGIMFLNMTLCGRRLTVNIQKAIYFRDTSQSQICSYVRGELRHRAKSHNNPKRYCTSSLARQVRYEESYRTRLVPATNQPNFHETFKFKLAEDCGRDYLVLTTYAMDADDTHKKRILGCMAFPISRLLKKARQATNEYFYYAPENENLEEVEINNEGYFLLDPKYGEKRNLPQSKVKRQTYYNDPTLSGTTSGSSFTSQGQMTAASSRLSVPNELTMGDYYGSSGDLRVRTNPNHNLDYTSASSSTNASSAANSDTKHKYHRATLPSITTTCENPDGDVPSPERNKLDHHFLCAENGGVYGAGPMRDEEPKKTVSVRRAASFTFSPKSSTAKNNQRPAYLREGEEKEKRRFLGPISKTLSYFRSKMDMALSSTTLYPTHEEVRQWETCFESLLQNKFGCALFRQFLKKEFSDENVDFWLECEEFKKMKDGKKATAQKAMEIYRQFVAEHAPKEVNLDCDTRAATKAALENGCRSDTFTLAQNRVEQLMSKDSYRRFLRDRLFLDLLESYEDKEQPSSSKEK